MAHAAMQRLDLPGLVVTLHEDRLEYVFGEGFDAALCLGPLQELWRVARTRDRLLPLLIDLRRGGAGVTFEALNAIAAASRAHILTLLERGERGVMALVTAPDDPDSIMAAQRVEALFGHRRTVRVFARRRDALAWLREASGT